jgi:raffinose/stachyose/melibiose transport system permease protein
VSSPSAQDGLDARRVGGVRAARPVARRRPLTWRRARRAITPYLYIAPTILIFGLLVLTPFIQTAWLSLFEWDGIGSQTYIGLGNYRDIWADPVVHSAFVHAFVLIIFFAAFPIAIGLALAATSMIARVRGDGFLRTMIFLPVVISTVVVGVTWNWILAPDGPLNQFLGAVHLDFLEKNWLGDFTWTLPAVGVIGTWTLIGLCVALFVAGIQTIPKSLYDAANVDGAGRIREFFSITVPGLRGPIAVAATLTVVTALRVFDIIFVTTRGGPGTATVTPGLIVYTRAFGDGRVGSACAVGVILAAVIFVLALIINTVADRTRA